MNGPRRLVVIPSIGGLAVAAVLSLAPTAASAAADGCQTTTSAIDFNGDGRDDAAVGDPEVTVNGQSGAGAVTLLLGGADGRIGSGERRVITRATLGETPKAGDHFGYDVYLAPAGLNSGCANLLIGSPGADVGGAADAGLAHLVRDYPDLEGTPDMEALTLTQADAGGKVEAHDQFGYAVAITGTTESELRRLVIGAPGESAGAVRDVGAVNVVNVDVFPAGALELRQGRPAGTGAARLPGTPQSGDFFGAALAVGRVDLAEQTTEATGQGLMIGAPGDVVSGRDNAGSVTVLPESFRTAGLITQSSPGVQGTAEYGDHFGSTLALSPAVGNQPRTLAVGSPGEDAGRVSNTGSVTLLTNTGERFVPRATFGQASAGVPGTNEAGDQFGSSLAFDQAGTLLVGVPNEDVGSVPDVGVVQPVRVPTTGALRFSAVLTEPSTAAYSRFGRTLSALSGQAENVTTISSYSGRGTVYVRSDRSGQRTWLAGAGADRFGWAVTN